MNDSYASRAIFAVLAALVYPVGNMLLGTPFMETIRTEWWILVVIAIVAFIIYPFITFGDRNPR